MGVGVRGGVRVGVRVSVIVMWGGGLWVSGFEGSFEVGFVMVMMICMRFMMGMMVVMFAMAMRLMLR